ncbi:MAG: M6 family metalloprotease domain-containing protein [Prevotella sp.]
MHRISVPMTRCGIMAAAIMLLSAQTVCAVPADPRPKKVQLTDGTWITVTTIGDEYGSVTLADDGREVVADPLTGRFSYINGDTADGNASTAERLRKIQAENKAIRRTNACKIATTGVQRSLVLLIEFSDCRFSSMDDAHDFYNRMLNEEGFSHSNGANGSARDFFISSSAGLFRPEFVVVGPIQLPQTAAYYGSDTPTRDARVGEVLRDACLAIDEEVDFSQFDTDGDGKVDNIYYFYAGYGQADNPSAVNTIWPQSSSLAAMDINVTCDGVTIDGYACNNELVYDGSDEPVPAGIGSFVHEFGHVLGLVDHYDVYDSRTFTVGPWDTMSTGSYNNNSHTPPLYSAFERAELGWLSYTELAQNTDTVTLLADLKDCNKALRVAVEGNDNEFFVMENRQQTGWDAYLPGHGMLVWHIDRDEQAWKDNTVNIDMSHQRVDIVAADGKRTDTTRDGDPFPGTEDVNKAVLNAWDGTVAFDFDAIVEQDATIKFIRSGADCRIAQPATVNIIETADSSISFSWGEVAEAAYYLVTVSEKASEGTKTPVAGFCERRYDAVTAVRTDGLMPLTDYEIGVTAAIGSYRSAETTAQTTTTDTPFEKLRPTETDATDITANAFTGSWRAVSGADNYAVTLSQYVTGEPTELGYDFGTMNDGMPATWNTTSTTYYSVSGYYGNMAPSLRLSTDGDMLEVGYEDCRMERLEFWHRSKNADGLIHIEVLTAEGTWEETASFTPSADGKVVSFQTNGAERARIRYERESGFVVIDDVVAVCRMPERRIVEGYDGKTVGNVLSFRFTNLAPATTYSFGVRALSGDKRSAESPLFTVTTTGTSDGIATPKGGNYASEAAYDLSGRQIREGSGSSSAIIIKAGKKRLAQPQR